MVTGSDVGGIRFIITYGGGLHTIQGAKVYINSPGMPFYRYIYVGSTDAYGVLYVPNLPIGNNKYQVSKTGYRAVTGTAVIIGGQMTYVNIDMVPTLSLGAVNVGNLNIVSNPPEACICIDEAVQNATTPVTIADVPEGDYTLILTKDGYNDYITLVTITNGQTTTISADLISL